jgi:hypothetical protein
MTLKGSISDAAVPVLVDAYRKITGSRFFNLKRTANAETTCKEFVRIAYLVGVTPFMLMEESIGMYGGEWCRETFKTPFPPFNVVVGLKARRRLLKNHKPKIAQTAEALTNQGRDIAHNLVNMMGATGAMELVKGGWPADERLRASVLSFLQEG